MQIKEILKKQGGGSLIKNYAYNHVLLYAFFVFFMVPKNTKGLELFRECINIRICTNIKRKYKKDIIQFIQKDKKHEGFCKPKLIWFCWLQGLDKAPPLVKACYESIIRNCLDYEIKVITADNFSEYTDIPDYIINKWKKGIITHAHFSDILRTSLLINNGGTWIDATVFLSGRIPIDVELSSLFMFRTYKPGVNGKALSVSSWFLSSEKNNLLLLLVQELLYKYWENHNKLADYFLFHIFVQIALDYLPEIEKKIPRYTNETPHFMLFELGNQFIQEKWESILSQSFCHKLTNKLNNSKKNLDGTFYKKITEI